MMDIISKEEARAYSPLTLAFFGDSVYEVLVRRKLLENGSASSARLHKAAVTKVRASYQSVAFDLISPLLNEEEADILRRGRNATGASVPNSASPKEYRRATALEALFGYLWLIGDYGRIDRLFEVCYDGEAEKEAGADTAENS